MASRNNSSGLKWSRAKNSDKNARVSNPEKETVSWYLGQIQKFPLLSHSESVKLFQDYENSNKKSKVLKDRLVTSNLRLVVSIAKRYAKTGIPLEDLCQEGNCGLMKAIDRYDWKRGFMFSTYATWWIRQSIGQHVLKRKRTIRLPAHAAAMQQKAITAAEDYRKEFGSEPSAEDLSEILGSSERIIKGIMQSGRNMLSLSSPLSTDDPSGDTLQDTISDETLYANPFESVAESELVGVARRVLDQLTDKEAAIIRLRFGISDDPTDHEQYPIDNKELDGVVTKGKGVK